MDNLSKENFWNKMYEDYPDAMKIFCEWIDDYKIENNWIEVFGKELKYHHLPLAMQIGIWIEFEFSQGCGNFEITIDSAWDSHENLEEWIGEYLRNRQIEFNPE